MPIFAANTVRSPLIQAELGRVDEFGRGEFWGFHRCAAFVVIPRLATGAWGGGTVSTTMSDEDWAHTLTVFRACLPRRGRKAPDDRPALSGRAACLHGGECALARPAEGIGPVEQRVEAVRSSEQGGRVRSLFRHSGVPERVGPSDPDVRHHDRARACFGGGSKRGQKGQALGRSRGGFTTKIHAKSDRSGNLDQPAFNRYR
jgi:hypothetical protein